MMYTKPAAVIFIFILFCKIGTAVAQAPNISYTTPQTFTTNTAITPLAPANTGGAVPAAVYGLVSTFAGSGAQGSTNGSAALASFYSPNDVTIDAPGNLYIADTQNNLIRKITPAGIVSTFAGSGAVGKSDGQGAAASFFYPTGITVDPTGNIYVADCYNNLIRKITPGGLVSTLSISGPQSANFTNPTGLVFDAAGNLYISDNSYDIIWKIDKTGQLSTFAGLFGTLGSTDGTGSTARFAGPQNLTIDGSGNIYVADSYNNKVRKITPAGVVTTMAGSGLQGSVNGPLLSASFNRPFGLAVDPLGNVYVADTFNNLIREITSAGVVTTLAGNGLSGAVNGLPLTANFWLPWGLVFDTAGNLYVADYSNNSIRKISLTGYTIDKPLPPGSSFDATTGIISGKPTATSPATNYTVTAYNTKGSSSTIVNISVNSAPPTITTSPATGNISACAGSASASPQIQQFIVSGLYLTDNITATAPTGFEVSRAAGSGYGNSATLTQTGGTVNSTVVYVRSAASASTGNISGNVVLTSTGAISQNVVVTGTVNALPTVNAVANQTVNNGTATTAVNFAGTANTFTWVNDTPGIGLAGSGSGNIASFTAVNTGSSPVKATITTTPVSAGYAYIANGGSNTVSVINTTTNAIISTISVGMNSVGVSVSPDGSRVYVTNSGDNTVSVINTATNTVIATIGVGQGPAGVSVSPDGSLVYVVNYSSATVLAINTVTNTVVGTPIPVGTKPWGISVSPDGSRVYVANSGDGTVSVINTSTDAVIGTIAVGIQPTGVSISPDGSNVHVTNQGSNTVSVINTTTNAVISTIPVGAEPAGLSVSPDGSRVYVGNRVSNSVSVINTATNTVIATVGVGSGPTGISISPDGSLVFVTNSGSNSVSVINTTTNAVISTVKVGSNPNSLGNYITGGVSCSGIPVIFTITVNPTVPTIVAGTATGTISACVGSASANPQIQQFTVSGSNLTGNITATAPTGFEVSLAAGIGYGSSVAIPQTGGTANSTVVYVRSAASDAAGPVSGNVTLTSIGATTQTAAVTGTVNALPTVNNPGNQIVNNGAPTTAVNFTGTGNTFNWVNDTPGIGLAASGMGNIASFTAVNTSSSPVKATVTVTPVNAGYAYIMNDGLDILYVINTATNTVVATIPGLTSVYGVSASPDGSRVYVTNPGANMVSVINTATNTVVSTIPVGLVPHGIVVSPDGTTLYVANYNSNTVSVISTATNTLAATVTVGTNPQGISINPDGSRVYVANFGSNTVSVINTATNAVTTITTGTGPTGVSVSPDGSRVYVTNMGDNTVSVINTATNAVIATITVGASPAGVSLSPDGSRLYVANYASTGTVSVINTATGAVINTIAVGSYPYGISVNQDGSQVYVENISSATVSVISTATNTVTGVTVGTGAASFGNFITPGSGCTGIPVKFTITVNPTSALPPTITAGTVTGTISACAGSVSISPQIQQFTVSGSSLTGSITATAPVGFEISLAAGSSYGNSITIPQTAGTANSTVVYVRSAASDAAGPVSGNVNITSTGATTQTIAVTGTVNALPTVNAIAAQNVNNGAPTTAVNFTGTGNVFNWVNDTPGIGLAASGTGDIASFTAVNKGSSAVKATITATPMSTGYAYVTNFNDGTVSVINTLTNTVVSTIAVGIDPAATAISPDGSTVYVANDVGTVSVINTRTNSVTATIKVGETSHGIAISADGTRVYVTNANDNTVSIIDTSNNTVIATIYASEGPQDIVISPDGSTLYVVGFLNGVAVINTSTYVITTRVAVGSQPVCIVESPDGSMLYVGNLGSKNISVINTKTNQVVATIPINDDSDNICISPDGKQVYVVDANLNLVEVINTSTNTVTGAINIGSNPFGVSVSPDGSLLYVSDANSAVAVFNIATGTLVSTVNVGAFPIISRSAILPGTGCTGTPTTFTITVNPTPAQPPAISVSLVAGNISACAGTASASPQLQQFTVSGLGLTADITATAPVNFEISLSATGGYGNSLILKQSGGTVNNTVIYVRSAASAPVGNISGNVTIASTGASTVSPGVTATVNALPVLNIVSNQAFTNGTLTTGVTFTGTATNINWVNDTPGIGLAASGNGNIAPFTAVNTGSSPVVAKIIATPGPVGFAYIVNANSNNVSVVNTATKKIVTTIPVGNDPQAVAVSPDGSKVYVANNNDNTISVINTVTNTVKSTFSVGVAPAGYPYGLAVSPDGSKLYVANEQSNEVAIVNTSTNAIVSTIAVGVHPEGIAVSPDGSTVYVVNNGGNTVSVINTGTNTVVSTFLVGNIPNEIAISPDGSKVYVTSETSLTVIDAKTNLITTTIQAPGGDLLGITISPDGNWVYVVNSGLNNVLVIDASTNAIASTISVGYNPQGLSLTPDGSQLFVTKGNANNVDIINTATGTVTGTIAVGSNPISFGNFILPGIGCPGAPVTFTITVNPTIASPTITTSPVSGAISACTGSASASPQIQQFTVSGSSLTGNITATAPAGFEISSTIGGSYGSSLILTQSGGAINSAAVYVRAAASAPTGSISGIVMLTSTGATGQNVPVTGTVNALPAVNTVAPQNVSNGAATTAVNFTGTGNNIYNWVNNTPGIGLAANGTGNIASFTAVNTGNSKVTATITVTPVPAGIAFITNFGDNTVSAINTATNTVVSVIPVGTDPDGASVSPDGSRVYVTNYISNTVSVINTATNGVIATITEGPSPQGIIASPDGGKVYVVNNTSNNVAVINTATNTVTASITVGQNPRGISVSPDGSRLYVTINSSNSVSVINTATNAVISTIQVGEGPSGVSVSPDGNFVYVANQGSNSVSVINTATNAVITIPTGTDPYGTSVSPDGTRVYVTNFDSGTVSVINTTTNTIIATIAVGTNPNGVSVSTDGSLVYVVNSGSATVSVINTATNIVSATINVGEAPESLGNFISGGTGCSGIPVNFTITVNPTAAPAAITAIGTPSPLNTIYGTPSTSTLFTVSGTNMTAGILVTPPAGFEVSSNDIDFSPTVTVGTSGTIAATTVYIRLASSAPVGHYSGNIVLGSTGAPNVNVIMPLSTVTPADLTITADNKSKIVGEANPVLTVTYSGFVNNDGPAQLTTQPVVTTTALTTSPVGQYPISVGGATSPNYSITPVQGTLTVNPVPLMVVIPNTFTPNGDGINDTWDIKNLEMYPSCTVQIFNRYGENVYTSNGYGIPWNGTYKGAALPTSTYYYMINLKNGSKVLSGFVAIIR